jgi:hypothetical protein
MPAVAGWHTKNVSSSSGDNMFLMAGLIVNNSIDEQGILNAGCFLKPPHSTANLERQ